MTAKYADPLRVARVSRADPRRAGRADLLARVRARLGTVLGGDLEPDRGARAEADARGHDRRGAAEHGVRHPLRHRDRAASDARDGARERARRPADGALAGRGRPRRSTSSTGAGLVRPVAARITAFRVLFAYPGILLATLFVSLPFVVREVVPVLREIGYRAGGGRRDARRAARSRPSGASRCRRSAGRSRTASC